MKNIIITILVVLVLILGFLYFTQKKNNVNYEPWPETTPATVRPTTNNTTNNYPVQNNPVPVTTTPTQQNTYEYKNEVGGFYVDLSGRVISESTIADQHRIFFDKPNRGVNEPRDFYVRYYTTTEWQEHWSSMSTTYDYVGTVSYNGITFQHYTKPAVDPGINDPQLIHFYMTNNDGTYYEIYSSNESYLNSFGFL